MRFSRYAILTGIVCLVLSAQQGYSQGCVAIRGSGGASCTLDHGQPDTSGWTISLNHRYFRSYRHFVGSIEQHERVENNTEVVNKTYNMDILIQRTLNRRWSVALNIPFVNNERSSRYEHGGNTAGPAARHATHSFGLSDMRVSVYTWLKDPGHARWNIQAGLGVKLPTGDYRFQDFFIRNDSVRTLAPVDQSIQLGDGGTGLSAELNAYYAWPSGWSLYGNGYYLANPREHNGVSTTRGATPTAAQVAYGSQVMSVPDQYMVRAGVSWMRGPLTLAAGVRNECIPVEDIIGGSSGFRRPGFVVTVEPGITYQAGRTSFYCTVPVAVHRERTQSVPDRIRTRLTGVYAHGDAAFADYAVNFGVIIRR